jgi:hypothetical protein
MRIYKPQFSAYTLQNLIAVKKRSSRQRHSKKIPSGYSDALQHVMTENRCINA